MKYRIRLNFFRVLGLIGASMCLFPLSLSISQESKSTLPSGVSFQCISKEGLTVAMKNLSSEDWAKVDQSSKRLIEYSRQSTGCRKNVIEALMQAMNESNLNFVVDRSSYFLWSSGSTILGQLKAVEALDLLIDHLDLNDGEFSSSMVHQPAFQGVRQMGALALPKLRVALRTNSNRNIRLAAASCLNGIGGPVATRSLREALRSESDPCVIRFIRISIDISKDKTRKKLTSDSAGFETELNQRRQLLGAFKCDN